MGMQQNANNRLGLQMAYKKIVGGCPGFRPYPIIIIVREISSKPVGE